MTENRNTRQITQQYNVLRIIARYAVATNPRDLGLTLCLTKLTLALAKRLSKHMNIFCKVA